MAGRSDQGAIPFQIFRRDEIPDNGKDSGTRPEKLTPVMEEGMMRLYDGGLSDGVIVKNLFDQPGFGLNYVWLKSGFPLPAHSHDAECLYYIIAGTVQLGNITLGKGDGFFVPKDSPYAYQIGNEGVEVLEIRHRQDINTIYTGDTKAYWDRLVAGLEANYPNWATEAPPQDTAAQSRERAE